MIDALVIFGTALPLLFGLLKIHNFLLSSIVISSLLIWPGYALVLSLWPKPNLLNSTQRLCLVPLFSILTIIFVLLIQDAIGYITPNMSYGIILVIVITLNIITRKDRQVPKKELAIEIFIFALVSGLMALAANQPSYTNILSSLNHDESYTESYKNSFTNFFIIYNLESKGNFDNNTITGHTISVPLGITNHEGVDEIYNIYVKTGDKYIYKSPDIVVGDNATVGQSINFIMPESGENKKVELILTRKQDATPYRTLLIKVNIVDPPSD